MRERAHARTLRQSRLAAGGLTQHGGARAAKDNGLRV